MDLQKQLQGGEDIHLIEAQNNFRYERKFTVPTNFAFKTIEQYIKRNSFYLEKYFSKEK